MAIDILDAFAELVVCLVFNLPHDVNTTLCTSSDEEQATSLISRDSSFHELRLANSRGAYNAAKELHAVPSQWPRPHSFSGSPSCPSSVNSFESVNNTNTNNNNNAGGMTSSFGCGHAGTNRSLWSLLLTGPSYSGNVSPGHNLTASPPQQITCAAAAPSSSANAASAPGAPPLLAPSVQSSALQPSTTSHTTPISFVQLTEEELTNGMLAAPAPPTTATMTPLCTSPCSSKPLSPLAATPSRPGGMPLLSSAQSPVRSRMSSFCDLTML